LHKDALCSEAKEKGMTYSVVLYSPDIHVVYDGQTPDSKGIGGGVTSRVRLLRALAKLGHRVTAFVNCDRPGVYDGVEYCYFEDLKHIKSDVLIAITTGGALAFIPLTNVSMDTRLRIVWAQGTPKPLGLEEVAPDFVYAASNFLREVIVDEWGISANRVFVCYSGLEQEYFREAETSASDRDPFAIVYLGHPSKGLEQAILVLRDLRQRDPRFHLDVYGGYEIWGQTVQEMPSEQGVTFSGLVGQRDLIPRLFTYGCCLALQKIPEGFGIAVQEAKRAGAIVFASKVGAYAELIQDGYDGFLIEDSYGTEACCKKAAEGILRLVEERDYAGFVRRNAMATPWDWEQAARTWTAHWERVWGKSANLQASESPVRYACPKCRVPLVELPDGWHCMECGRYYLSLGDVARFVEQSAYYGEITQPEFQKLLGGVCVRPWREVVSERFASSTSFLYSYILDESRGFFHFLVDLTADSVVLDLGAGYGTITAPISRRCHVVALDNTLLRLAFLRERCRQDRLRNVTIVYGDALELPFEPEQFDLVTMIGLLEWAGAATPELILEKLQERFLCEAYRVLKPGGCLYIGIENRYGFKYLLGEPDDHTGISDITYISREDADIKARATKGSAYRVRTHSKSEYEDLLRAAGFQQIEFYAPYPDYRMCSAWVPLDPPMIVQFYLDYLQEDFLPSSKAQQIQSLERVASRLGNLECYVNSYAILAWR
jgi:SAM-dependent methyltransferase/glycosyltransferase involved in cell wall biosynthesis